jgi:hypothetical protein
MRRRASFSSFVSSFVLYEKTATNYERTCGKPSYFVLASEGLRKNCRESSLAVSMGYGCQIAQFLVFSFLSYSGALAFPADSPILFVFIYIHIKPYYNEGKTGVQVTNYERTCGKPQNEAWNERERNPHRNRAGALFAAGGPAAKPEATKP